MGEFDDMFSFSDAAKIWGREESTLRKGVANGKLVDGVDCKKFGKQWVVLASAMAREYGGWGNYSVYKAELRKKEKLEREAEEVANFTVS